MTRSLRVRCAAHNAVVNGRGTGYHIVVESAARALIVAADALGAWETGWELAAAFVAEVGHRITPARLDELDADAVAAVCSEAYRAAALEVDGEQLSERIGAAALLVGPRGAELFWAGAFKLFLIRDHRVAAETAAHVRAEERVGAMSRRAAYQPDPHHPELATRTRGLQHPIAMELDRLAAPWQLAAGDALVLGNEHTWQQLEDTDLVTCAEAGRPPHDAASRVYQFAAVVTVGPSGTTSTRC
ncbi:MAG TPA: hypothetical protein VHW23_21265 [Kofleriaceae bacterium]|jgi:hypothetical protein|nr:hypothetical protein [Kofleriaceae bacterium]